LARLTIHQHAALANPALQAERAELRQVIVQNAVEALATIRDRWLNCHPVWPD